MGDRNRGRERENDRAYRRDGPARSPVARRDRGRSPNRSRSRSPPSNYHHYRRRDHSPKRQRSRSPHDNYNRKRQRSPSPPRRRPSPPAATSSRPTSTSAKNSFSTNRQSSNRYDQQSSTKQPEAGKKEEDNSRLEAGEQEEEEEEIIIDEDALLDLEELEAKQRAEEEELARQAEERRRRLEEIKNKHSQQQLPPNNSSITTTSTTTTTTTTAAVINVSDASSSSTAATMTNEKQSLGEEEEEDDGEGEIVVTMPSRAMSKVRDDGRLMLDDPMVAAVEEGDEPITTIIDQQPLEERVNDEGAQLAREKIALQAEESAKLNNFTFDIFSDSPVGGLGMTAAGAADGGKRLPALGETLLDGEGEHLQSNWDDGDGYYKATIGERVGDRFHVQGILGKGVFSTVLKCRDIHDKPSQGQKIVAVKMIRNNDTMRKAAEKEKSILLDLALHDPGNKRFCVRLLTYLDYRQHVALVLEYQQMNLREALKKFGKDVGINIGAVRIYGRQLMVALRYLMELKIVHADIKLDNILCSEDLKTIKLCDFGSAFRETDSDNDPTPYLVSRFYRAPEIILGMNYDRAIDLWSICVCLYELFTGHVMFPGRTNNEMLRLMMEMKGRLNNRLIRAHIRAYEMMSLEAHFDADCRFRQYETDPVSGKTVLRLVNITQPTRDLASIMRSSKAGADDIQLVQNLTDLLERGLNLDPSKRLTVVDALKHPFLVNKKD
eukprot:gene2249-2463_t